MLICFKQFPQLKQTFATRMYEEQRNWFTHGFNSFNELLVLVKFKDKILLQDYCTFSYLQND